MNRDLFLAILSMDSYNRGYGTSVILPEDATHIGGAEILFDSEDRSGITGGEAAGFYAIAYDDSHVEIGGLSGTVISYRGTDRKGALPWTLEGSDLVQDYGLAAGGYDAPQAKLALIAICPLLVP